MNTKMPVGFQMQEQIEIVISLAEDTVERLAAIAMLRRKKGRELSRSRRAKLERLRDLLSRIDELTGQ